MADGSQNRSFVFDEGESIACSAVAVRQEEQARIFRAIGQDLEAKAIATFCLRFSEDRYFVRGLVEMRKEKRRSSLWAPFRKKPACDDALELTYSMEELERLDALGRARRSSGHKLPEFFSVSQQMRALAALIGRKGGHITRVDRVAYAGMIPSIEVHYKTTAGDLASEEHSAGNLYDYCVHMFKTRKPQPARYAFIAA